MTIASFVVVTNTDLGYDPDILSPGTCRILGRSPKIIKSYFLFKANFKPITLLRLDRRLQGSVLSTLASTTLGENLKKRPRNRW